MPDVVQAIQQHGREAWQDFLEDFSPFILSCIRRYASDSDERMDIYVHVCKRLSADECRRLRQYRGGGANGACKFTTWLAAVVFNVAREWIRSSRGRRRLFRSLQDMSRIDRLVFKYHYWEGYSAVQVLRVLRSGGHRRCDVQEVNQRLASIERKLTNDHRWRLVSSLGRSRRLVSLDSPKAVVGDAVRMEISDSGVDIAGQLQLSEAALTLQSLMRDLPDQERTAVRLRFERGLKAKEIARVLEIENYKRVYEIQGRALQRLEKGLAGRGFELGDFLNGSAMWLEAPD